MDASSYAASLHSFFSNEDSRPTYRCCSRSIIRIYIFILYMNMQLISALPDDPQLYWKSMLPTTPMPKSIAGLLLPAVHAGKSGDDAIFHGVTEFNASLGAMRLHYGSSSRNRSTPGIGHETELQDNPNSTVLFLLEKDLKFGNKMKILFTQSSNQAYFVPRQVVKSIPFASTKMEEILNKFGVQPGSVNAEALNNTIELCEESAIKGEDKYCATSLESMVDFIVLKLGKKVEALSTEEMEMMKKKKKEIEKQEYKIIKNGVKKVGEAKVVVCHKLDYVYAVFYCHKLEKTVAYTVSLEGIDGSRVKAVSVCHRDTSAWNPKHLAFQMLKVKPGSVPICHLISPSDVVWALKQN